MLARFTISEKRCLPRESSALPFDSNSPIASQPRASSSTTRALRRNPIALPLTICSRVGRLAFWPRQRHPRTIHGGSVLHNRCLIVIMVISLAACGRDIVADAAFQHDASIATDAGVRNDAQRDDVSPRILGTVIETGSDCPRGVSGDCSQLEVTCQGLAPAAVYIQVFEPPAGEARGTVVFGSGGGGTGFYGGRPEGRRLFEELVAAGYRIIDRAWERSWYVDAGVGLAVSSCRYATLLEWLKLNHASGAFCASGNSGGAAEIGYALTRWESGDILDLAVPTGGPAAGRLDYVCLGEGDAEWLELCDELIPDDVWECSPTCTLEPTRQVCTALSPSPTASELRADSVAAMEALYHYPHKVHFLYGTRDCDGPNVPSALNWANAVTSEKEIEFVPNTPHVMVTAVEGREAIRDAIFDGC